MTRTAMTKIGKAAFVLAVAAAFALLGWIVSETRLNPALKRADDFSVSVSPPAASPWTDGAAANCVDYVQNWRAGGRPGDDGFGARYLRLGDDTNPGVARAAGAAARALIEHIIDGTQNGPTAEAQGTSVFYLCRAAYPAETKS